MQEFCPECQKNGLRTRVKTFQINLEEAVLMCSSGKCTWPLRQQTLTIIKRPVNKDWSKTWDEQEHKYFNHDALMELSSYTPPQTPGTDVIYKDPPVSVVAMTVQPTDKACNPIVLVNKGVNSKEIFKMLTKSKDLLNGTISNSMNSKPKELILRPVLTKIQPSHVFTKDKVNGDAILRVENNVDRSKVAQKKMIISTSATTLTTNSLVKVNPPTVSLNPVTVKKVNSPSMTLNPVAVKKMNSPSIALNPLAVKTENSSSVKLNPLAVKKEITSSTKVNPLAAKPQAGLKKLGKRKSTSAIQEFDFESMKAKSTNVVKEGNSPVVKIEKGEKIFQGTHQVAGKVKMNVIIKSEKKEVTEQIMEPVVKSNKIGMLPVNKFENNDLPPMNELHLDCKDVKPVVKEKTSSPNSSDTSQAFLDTSMSLSTDPTFDEDILTITDDDTDLNLEDLLAGFSEEIGPAVKSELPNVEDDWINDLFN